MSIYNDRLCTDNNARHCTQTLDLHYRNANFNGLLGWAKYPRLYFLVQINDTNDSLNQ